MIRSELVALIAAQNPHLYERDIHVLIKTIFNRIAAALAAGDRVEICNFGTFEVRKRNARLAHIPKTGKRVAVASRITIGFRVGQMLRNHINGVGDGLERDAVRLL